MGTQQDRAAKLFEAIVELPTAVERTAFLDAACGEDSQLRAEVEELLAHDNAAGSFLNVSGQPQPPATLDDPISERPGSVIGPYKLLEQIGEGGFGVVFMAEQMHPVRRKVALKVLKPGMDTRQVVARFEAERQALALMDHPNIAHVFDGGETATGRPYFVMELVRGIPITTFCDQNRLPIRERLELFIDVCQAVQHAHQKGIIHRDLKPNNVLITLHDGTPVVKVIDFGVAKATGQQLTEKTLFTNFAQMVGTPLYMSPEQAEMSGLDIDTRADIYALGVLLYELLTGTTPFDKMRMREAGYDEMRRIIREEDPPKPSTRVSTLAQVGTTLSTQRKTDPKRLSQLFRAELDWIVMKCLEKDRNRRYETANGLGMDLRRYLADEPVQACPPSTVYRLRKFARKYRTLLRVAVAFVVLLILATAVSTWQAVLATRAKQQAVMERDRAETSFRTARDAVDQLFTQVSQSPKLKVHAMETFRKDLLRSAKDFYERFIREQFDAPGVRYDLGMAQYRLGEIHRELGNYTAAEESLTKAIDVFADLTQTRPDVAEYQRDLGTSCAMLAQVYSDTGKWQEAETTFEQALSIQEKQVETYPIVAEYQFALAKTYRACAYMLHRRAFPERAEARFQQALNILTKLVQDHPVAEYQALLASTLTHLGIVYSTKGWFEKTEKTLKEAQRLYERLAQGKRDVLPEHWQLLGRSHAILGMGYRGQSQLEKAEASAQKAIDIFAKLAKEHPDVLEYTYDMGRCYSELGLTANYAGRPDEAIARFDKSMAILEDVLSKGYGSARNTLVNVQIDRGTARACRGDHAQATAEAEIFARKEGLHSGHLYDLACTFSQASAAAVRDSKLSLAERGRLKERYANRAMEFLHRAVAEGWLNPQALEKDPDMKPLRTREDLRKLLAEIEAKTKE